MTSKGLDGPAAVVIGRREAERLLDLDDVAAVVEESYRSLALGEARLFPLVREPLPEGALFGLRSAIWPERGLLGLKVSGYCPANSSAGRDNHQSTIVLVDPRTGMPRAFVDGNHVTWVRTAAAGLVGSRTLARTDARVVLVVGNGLQAAAQAQAHFAGLAERSPEILVHAPRDTEAGAKARAFAERLAARGIPSLAMPDLGEALARADIVVTATPSREPLLPAEALRPGTHVTAVGSDGPGKRELPDELVRRARVVVDDREQSARFGETQGLEERELEGIATIGEVLLGRAEGRVRPDEVTIFDSTGIGLHDLVTAELALARAPSTSTAEALLA